MCIVALPQDADQPAAADWAAHLLTAQQRRQLALAALAGQPISHLAQHYQVSRKFVYQQLDIAHQALEHAFAAKPPEQEPVLFYLPVTRSWLRQLVLALVLICHSSRRGVVELLADLFDYRLSLGTVHHIVHSAVPVAERIDRDQGLSAIRQDALDEIFQAVTPVLVGADVHSGYCFLLSAEEHRDGDTWAIRLLELRDRGFRPHASIADFGSGLRKGHEQALPGVGCRGDVFHALADVGPLLGQLDKRAYQAIATLDELQRRQARFESRHGRKDRGTVNRLIAAAREVEQAVALADEVATLLAWLRQDILAVAGPEHSTRQMLYDWVVAELQAREGRCERIGSIRRRLHNQRDNLLAFAAELDGELLRLADGLQIPVAVVREALAVQQGSQGRPAAPQRSEHLQRQLGEKYAVLRVQLDKLAARVVRASGVIENLNSRLRNYFFLSKHLGPEALSLLKFFLNHRRLVRSEYPDRVGKSPRELLSGQEHGHWLELLGYQRFRRAA